MPTEESGTPAEVVYRSSCDGCSWEKESENRGLVEEEALAHMRHNDHHHSTEPPELIEEDER